MMLSIVLDDFIANISQIFHLVPLIEPALGLKENILIDVTKGHPPYR